MGPSGNHSDKTRLAVLSAVLTTVAVLALSLLLTAPVWVWAAVMVVANALAVLISIQVMHRREQAELRKVLDEQRTAKAAAADPAAPGATGEQPAQAHEPEPPTHVQYPVSAVPLPSSEVDYRFLFSATVCWRQASPKAAVPHASPGDLAVHWILTRARELTVLEKPEEYRVVQHRLAVALGTALAEPYGHVVAWAVDVSLTMGDDDARRLDRLAELRKHERMWEQERRMEISMRRYLSEDVLKDTGSAVVWWLARHTEEIENSVEMIGHLAQLTAAANSREIPGPELLRAIQAAENGRHINGSTQDR
ncbi:hypothetical protein [Kibdelosporangium phytohabitans]|uniref:Uncharacterized protein n=1 Tax=Kibdelosporangium phytohabitans TaxID=860235 RepID=A0A0N9I2W3_9PSEU|nr:hypothetical protein [Kibdelosporangium phytohabitans]ALG09082.1 hypothetical protein AOZ06_21105 [Kibdelosporangium phytohabitans]MBE1469724.1 heme exporter protein D [Kibdelosporangium phytohabitans]